MHNCRPFDLCDNKKINFDSFKLWYHQKNKEPFVLSTITDMHDAPLPNGKYYTQRLSYKVGVIRNNMISERIESALNQNNTILVIYGSGHFFELQNILKDMLGEPKIVAKPI